MDRILTTHVGSLIRPKGLRDLLAAKDRGRRSLTRQRSTGS